MLVTTTAAASKAAALSSKFFLLKSPPRFQSPVFRPFSSASPYPLYYELIHHRPVRQPPATAAAMPHPTIPNSNPTPSPSRHGPLQAQVLPEGGPRMFGGDSDTDGGPHGSSGEVVELKPEVVDFPRLRAREQELYFHDAFAFPWEKDKHYRMFHQLEKKYFPDPCLGKAFVDPEVEFENSLETKNKNWNLKKKKKTATATATAKEEDEERDNRALVFFDDGEKGRETEKDVLERKVQEFFKCLKKVPSGGGSARRRVVAVAAEVDNGGEPFLVSRQTEMPPRWDGPYGTLVFVDNSFAIWLSHHSPVRTVHVTLALKSINRGISRSLPCSFSHSNLPLSIKSRGLSLSPLKFAASSPRLTPLSPSPARHPSPLSPLSFLLSFQSLFSKILVP